MLVTGLPKWKRCGSYHQGAHRLAMRKHVKKEKYNVVSDVIDTCSGSRESIKENLFGISCGSVPEGTCDLTLEEVLRCPRWEHSRQRNQFVQRHRCVKIVSEFNFVGVWVPCRMVGMRLERQIMRHDKERIFLSPRIHGARQVR